MRLPECWQWCPWGFMGCGRQERCFGRCNKMIPESLFDTTPPHPQMCGSSPGCAVLADRSAGCPPAGRIPLPDRKEIDSVFRWVGGALGPPLEMSAESASWLRVTSGLGKFFLALGKHMTAYILFPERGRVGIVYWNLIERMPPTGPTVSLGVFL